jgi:hypothetical protein
MPRMTQPTTQRVNTRRVNPLIGPTPPRTLEQDLAIARLLAQAMDSQFEIAGIKFGLDAVIGLVPIAGDIVSFAVGTYPIYLARKHGLGKLVVGRMLMNLGADFLIGVVPVVGDALDVFVKANLKNYKLLEDAAAKRR